MARKPTVNSDSVAQDMIRSYFERWQRMEEEKQAISDDLKELFAEAKGMGFDTKVLRKLFRDKVGDYSERMEFEALYELYAAALGMVDATGARPARADDDDEQDSEPAHDSDPKPETQAAVTVPPNGEAEEASAPASSAPIQPETANEVPAQDSGGNETRSVGDHSKPLGKSNAARPASVDAQHNGGGSAGEAGESAVTAGETATSNIVRLGSGKPLRPFCQHMDDLTKCGGYGKTHCGECLAAMKRMPVEAGGVEIEHGGLVS